MSSISGIVNTTQHHFPYNTSEVASIHLTKLLAHEFTSCQYKIRVNGIATRGFPTEMTTEEGDEKQKSIIPKEKLENKLSAVRTRKDEAIARAVPFNTANSYLNGETIVIGDGYLLATGTV